MQTTQHPPVRAFGADDHHRGAHGRDHPPAAEGMPRLPRDGGRGGAQPRLRQKDRRRLLLQRRQCRRKGRRRGVREVDI